MLKLSDFKLRTMWISRFKGSALDSCEKTIRVKSRLDPSYSWALLLVALFSPEESGPQSQVRVRWLCRQRYRAVLEYWSIGVLRKAITLISTWRSPYRYSITPPLHYSSRIMQMGKTYESPTGADQSRILWARILYYGLTSGSSSFFQSMIPCLRW